MNPQDMPPLVIPAAVMDMLIAAIRATQAWSCLPFPLPELDPAMQELREALRPLLGFQQDFLRQAQARARPPHGP